ncbi:prealbumin-like fold domain-containing protein, partial [Erysipelatoclostridium ramosum]
VKFFVKDPLSTFIDVKVNKYGSLKITKQDEDGAVVPNTSFKVSKNADMSSPIGTYKTGGDGTVTVNNLLPQKYYVQETAVPSHLVLDTTIR